MSTVEGTVASTTAYESGATVSTTEQDSASAATSSTSASSAVESTSGIDQSIVQSKAACGCAADDYSTGMTKVLDVLTTLVNTIVQLFNNFLARTTPGGTSSSSDNKRTDSASQTSSGSSQSTSSNATNSASSGASNAQTSGASNTRTGGTGSGDVNKNTASAPSSSASTSGAQKTTGHLESIRDDKGVVTVRTPDGYSIIAEGVRNAWRIVGADGKTTRIFGDPHVEESDGTKWSFAERGSFLFGKNKVTVETVKNQKGKAVTARITIYSGSERVTVGDIDKNRPVILANSSDGLEHDDSLSDGVRYNRGVTKNGESWSIVQNGKRREMGGK